jgi:lipopolysaccharide export system protein LptA
MLDHEDNHRTLFASPKVRIFSNQLQAIADSAMYQSKEGLVHLYKSPILWSNNAELKGDTVRMVLKDSLVEQVSVTGNATTIIAVDTGKYYNQLSGKRIISYVNNNEITKAEVKGNAWTVYYPIEDVEEDTVVIRKRIGMNRLYASDLVVFLKEGEVDRITYLDKPDGIFYPMDKIDEKEKFIKNFSWNPGKRPRRPNVSRKYR